MLKQFENFTIAFPIDFDAICFEFPFCIILKDVEILNPDLVICNLDENTNFHMEMNINTGKGYVPAELNKPEEPPLGLIAIDSLYSPVKKVSYSVSTAREGKALDYDKLTMEIETNGSISAEDALAYSARIFQDQYQRPPHCRLLD